MNEKVLGVIRYHDDEYINIVEIYVIEEPVLFTTEGLGYQFTGGEEIPCFRAKGVDDKGKEYELTYIARGCEDFENIDFYKYCDIENPFMIGRPDGDLEIWDMDN